MLGTLESCIDFSYRISMIGVENFRTVPILGRWLVCVALGIWGLVGLTAIAQAGHTNGQGRCNASPQFCRASWSGPNTSLPVRAIDDFSGTAPYWALAANNAIASWSNVNGPQHGVVKWSAQTNDTWDYFHYSTTGNHGLTNGNVLGITWNCDTFHNCYDTNIAIVVLWSDVYLNGSTLTNSTTYPIPFATQWTFAHELGHTLGLDHHSDNYHLMNPTGYPYYVNGPTDPGDLGSLPICPATKTNWGVRCIYGWSLS